MSDRPEPITVGELRDRLANFHDATLVVVGGYEGGYDFPSAVGLADVKKTRDAWYYGRFERVAGDDVVGSREVVVISR